jgi:hypothetical protein
MHSGELFKISVMLALAIPAWGQYSGPALLSRGEAPAAMSGPQIEFRPYVEVSAAYDTGLSGVTLTNTGNLANESSVGGVLTWGVSGNHAWRHTGLGLDYRGSINHFARSTSYDSVNQSLLLGLTHDISKHAKVSIRQSAGTFARDFGPLGLVETIPFDPTTSFVPTTDYFDNRTMYLSTQADLTIQKSARLSYSLGGAGFITRRRSAALAGVNGEMARADVHYRISRRTTLGGIYDYTHFEYTHFLSEADLHRFGLSFGTRLSRWWEISGYVAAMRMEAKTIQSVAVDPVITALLGITASNQIVHRINWVPSFAMRASRTFQRGVAFATVGQTVTPGNGLFLTSKNLMVSSGYSYTGLRRWSFGSSGFYNASFSMANVQGQYGSYGGTISMSRQIGRWMHAVVQYSARQYMSSDFIKYDRLIHQMRIGFGFTPGDVPLRVW